MSKIIGTGAPTSTTPGIVGQEYYDKITKKSYICTDADYEPGDRVGEIDGTYVWEERSGASWNDLEEVTVAVKTSGGATSALINFPSFTVGDTVVISVDGIEYSVVAYDSEGLIIAGDSGNEINNATGEFGWSVIKCPFGVGFYSITPHTVSYISKISKQIDQEFSSVVNLIVEDTNGEKIWKNPIEPDLLKQAVMNGCISCNIHKIHETGQIDIEPLVFISASFDLFQNWYIRFSPRDQEYNYYYEFGFDGFTHYED